MKNYLIFLAGVVVSCANPVSPTGGAKDIEAPKIIKIHIDSQEISNKLIIEFDEHIQFNNDITLNPKRATEKKVTVEKYNRKIIIPLQKHHTSISLTNSIKDLNENNKGIYKTIRIGKDTLDWKHTNRINDYFKTDKKYLYAEVKQDTFIYTSYAIDDTLYIAGFPNETRKVNYYVDKNKNQVYDSTEWSIQYNLDTLGPTYLYPPKKIVITVDTNYKQVVAIIPFYAITETTKKLATTEFFDTFLFSFENYTRIIRQFSYQPIYKGIKLKPQIIKEQVNRKSDTTIRYYKNIGLFLFPDSPKDTLNRTIKMGLLEIAKSDSLKKRLNPIQIILTKKGSIFQNSFTLVKDTLNHSLESGEYYITAYIDENSNQFLDQQDGQQDTIIHFMETLAIKGNTTTVFNLGLGVNKEGQEGGKNKPVVPINIQLKKGVDQSQTIAE